MGVTPIVSMDQPQVTLNDGRTLPQVGLGVFKVPDAEAAQVVTTAIETGYRLVDTAAIYGNEAGVGAALREPQAGGIAVTTKLWNDRHEAKAARAALQDSLHKLGRDRIDLYLIHWPVQASDYVGTWKALIDFQKEGLVTSIGVSNFTVENLSRIIEATGVVPAVNQIELHPSFQQAELRAFHARHGIVTESWSPLGQGAALSDPQIGAIARKHGKTPAQVILRWHVDSGFMVIPKSVTPARIRENFAIFDFALDRDDLAVIAGLDRADGRIGPNPVTFG